MSKKQPSVADLRKHLLCIRNCLKKFSDKYEVPGDEVMVKRLKAAQPAKIKKYQPKTVDKKLREFIRDYNKIEKYYRPELTKSSEVLEFMKKKHGKQAMESKQAVRRLRKELIDINKNIRSADVLPEQKQVLAKLRESYLQNIENLSFGEDFGPVRGAISSLPIMFQGLIEIMKQGKQPVDGVSQSTVSSPLQHAALNTAPVSMEPKPIKEGKLFDPYTGEYSLPIPIRPISGKKESTPLQPSGTITKIPKITTTTTTTYPKQTQEYIMQTLGMPEVSKQDLKELEKQSQNRRKEHAELIARSQEILGNKPLSSTRGNVPDNKVGNSPFSPPKKEEPMIEELTIEKKENIYDKQLMSDIEEISKGSLKRKMVLINKIKEGQSPEIIRGIISRWRKSDIKKEKEKIETGPIEDKQFNEMFDKSINESAKMPSNQFNTFLRNNVRKFDFKTDYAKNKARELFETIMKTYNNKKENLIRLELLTQKLNNGTISEKEMIEVEPLIEGLRPVSRNARIIQKLTGFHIKNKAPSRAPKVYANLGLGGMTGGCLMKGRMMYCCHCGKKLPKVEIEYDSD